MCHLLKQLILVHVLFGGHAGALCLFFEGLIGGHEWGLLGKQGGNPTQQPAHKQKSGQRRTGLFLNRSPIFCLLGMKINSVWSLVSRTVKLDKAIQQKASQNFRNNSSFPPTANKWYRKCLLTWSRYPQWNQSIANSRLPQNGILHKPVWKKCPDWKMLGSSVTNKTTRHQSTWRQKQPHDQKPVKQH